MSLILDALRKSDVEHARQKAPGIATAPAPSDQKPRSLWWYAVPALLLVNAAFLAWLAFSANDSTPSTKAAPDVVAVPVSTARDASSQTNAAPARDIPIAAEPIIPSRKANVRSLLDETATLDDPARNAAIDVSVASATPQTTNTITNAGAVTDDPGLALPTLNELRADGSVSLPDLSIALHVYNASPDSRFAFIGGRKVSEGGRLQSGPSVVEITPYGVILDYEGRRFLLPRE
ncbi:MAG: general secretion pathway protein GspB [Pseudomonadota bacterium]